MRARVLVCALAAAVLVLGVAGWWGGGHASAPEPVAAAPFALAPGPVAQPPGAAVVVGMPAPAGSVAGPMPFDARCPHQQLRLRFAADVLTTCVGATQSRQSGSVRHHEVEAEGLGGWRARVSVADGRVVTIRLSATGAGAGPRGLACSGRRCDGATLGPPDAEGARTFELREVPLRENSARHAPGGGPAGERATVSAVVAHLSATLRTLPERQVPGLACDAAGVTVIEAGGGRHDFCPLGGAGFELADEGRPRYRFDSLDGQSLTIELTQDGAIDRVALGRLGCAAPRCGGVTTAVHGDPARVGAERHFLFSGATLTHDPRDAAGAAAATVNGSLTMPTQEE